MRPICSTLRWGHALRHGERCGKISEHTARAGLRAVSEVCLGVECFDGGRQGLARHDARRLAGYDQIAHATHVRGSTRTALIAA